MQMLILSVVFAVVGLMVILVLNSLFGNEEQQNKEENKENKIE